MKIKGEFLKSFNPFYAPKSLNSTFSDDYLSQLQKEVVQTIESGLKALRSS